jgi:hypothetical protein
MSAIARWSHELPCGFTVASFDFRCMMAEMVGFDSKGGAAAPATPARQDSLRHRIEASPVQSSGLKSPVLIIDPPTEAIAPVAATNKCLARSNKSHTGGKTTKKKQSNPATS